MSVGVSKDADAGYPAFAFIAIRDRRPRATDGSRSVRTEGGAGAADNAEYERMLIGEPLPLSALRITQFCAYFVVSVTRRGRSCGARAPWELVP